MLVCYASIDQSVHNAADIFQFFDFFPRLIFSLKITYHSNVNINIHYSDLFNLQVMNDAVYNNIIQHDG